MFPISIFGHIATCYILQWFLLFPFNSSFLESLNNLNLGKSNQLRIIQQYRTLQCLWSGNSQLGRLVSLRKKVIELKKIKNSSLGDKNSYVSVCSHVYIYLQIHKYDYELTWHKSLKICLLMGNNWIKFSLLEKKICIWIKLVKAEPLLKY